jgi:hypothetical protein
MIEHDVASFRINHFRDAVDGQFGPVSQVERVRYFGFIPLSFETGKGDLGKALVPVIPRRCDKGTFVRGLFCCNE